MAIYHAEVKTITRARGQSSVEAAAYRAGALLLDRRTGRYHDYRSGRRRVRASGCIAPPGSPSWALDPRVLWSAAEQAENRKNSVVAREFVVALPCELTDAQRATLAETLTARLVNRFGFAAQWNIHAPADGLNHHVHIQATSRQMEANGLTTKTRELDSFRPGQEVVSEVRMLICDCINKALAMAGLSERTDHRTLKAQRMSALEQGDLDKAKALDRLPTVHLGKAATALERKGIRTRLGAYNDAVRSGVFQASDLHETDKPREVPPKLNGAEALAHRRAAKAALQAARLGQEDTEAGLGGQEAIGQSEVQAMADEHDEHITRARDDSCGQPMAPELDHTALFRQSGYRPESIDFGRLALFDGSGVAMDQTTAAILKMPFETADEQRRAGAAAMAHAFVVWNAGFATKVRADWERTAALLQRWAARVAAYETHKWFNLKARELLHGFRKLLLVMGRHQRRQEEYDAAYRRLQCAQEELQRFEREHPFPGPWLPESWHRRRNLRTQLIDQRNAEVEQAMRGVNHPDKLCEDRILAREAAEEVTDICSSMLRDGPINGEQPNAPRVDADSSVDAAISLVNRNANPTPRPKPMF